MQQQTQAEREGNHGPRGRHEASLRLLERRELLCPDHSGVVAVSTCTVCGRGLCATCQVGFGGRRYCRRDAQLVLNRAKSSKQPMSRGGMLTAASTLAYLQGGIGSAVGFLLILLGLMSPSVIQGSASYSAFESMFSSFNGLLIFPSGIVLGIGSVIFALGLVTIAAGNSLWKRSRVAGVVAIASCIFSVLIGGAYPVVMVAIGPLLFLWVGISAADASAVVLAWKRLR
jgi:hypothetical protein